MLSKHEIRKLIKDEKSKLSHIEIEKVSDEIIKQFISSNEYNQADIICTYVAFNQEILTNSFIEYSILNGKKVAVPKVQNQEMDFYYITDLSELEIGYYGILEPKTSNKVKEDELKDKNVLMIMPGLAFDLKGNRIGYGGGYYDKYLEKHEKVKFLKIAFAYEFQILKDIEVDKFDKKVDQIITSKNWIKIREESEWSI